MRKYWPLPPKGAHRSFRVMSQDTDGRRQVKDPRLDAINGLFRAGTIDRETADRQVQEIVAALRKAEQPDRPVYPDANLDIAQRYIREEYETRDILPGSLAAAKASVRRALDLLGTLDLATADVREVQKRIYTLPYEKRPHVILALNCLFRYVGRPHRFDRGRQTKVRRVRHLSLSEMLQVLPYIKRPLVRQLAAVTFATGARLGEVFALDRYNEVTRQVTIMTQVDRKLGERLPKTFERTAVVVKELADYVTQWVGLPREERLSIRNVKLAGYLTAACQQAFPGRLDKHCHFYDLRHSYAIHFLSRGASVALVAQQLGNSESVCREHYVGYITSDDGAALLNTLQDRKTG